MKNIYVKGYINYENTSYTFSYENKKLTLINIENKQSFFSEYKYVEFFKGFTVDGFDILFYINNDIYYVIYVLLDVLFFYEIVNIY